MRIIRSRVLLVALALALASCLSPEDAARGAAGASSGSGGADGVDASPPGAPGPGGSSATSSGGGGAALSDGGTPACGSPGGACCTTGAVCDVPLACVDAKCFATPLSPSPTARHYHQAVTSGGRIYVLGGTTLIAPRVYVRTVEVYDPAANTWTTRASMNAPRIAFAAVVGGDGRIYVFGGEGPPTPGVGAVATSSAEVYDPATNTWTNLPDMPASRSWHGAGLAADGRIYVVGGRALPRDYFARTVEVFDPTTSTWGPTRSPSPPLLAESGVAFADGAGVHLMSGVAGSLPDVHGVYLPATNEWSARAPTAFLQGSGGAAGALGPDGRFYAIKYSNTVVYDGATNAWILRDAPPGPPRYGTAAAFGLDGRLYLVGGSTGTYSAPPAIAIPAAFDVMANRWYP